MVFWIRLSRDNSISITTKVVQPDQNVHIFSFNIVRVHPSVVCVVRKVQIYRYNYRNPSSLIDEWLDERTFKCLC